MPSSFTTNGGIELPANGEQDGIWGDTVNDNMQIIDRLTNGVGAIALSGTTHTLTTLDGDVSDGHYAVLVFGGAPSGTNTVTINPNDAQHVYIVRNTTSESVVLTQGSGGNVTVAAGKAAIVACDGAGSVAAVTDITSGFSFQAPSAALTAISGLAVTDGNFIVGNGTTWVAESGNTVLTSIGVTATTTELSYVAGVTSSIQTQLDNKVGQTSATGAASIPAGTQAQRPTPAAGQFRLNTDAGSFEGYNGSVWISLGGGAINDLFYENAQTVSANYTVSATRNAMTTGPITINDGVTVTVSDGARWVVL